jgi:uncharacterized protein (DUF1810 family)
MQRLRIAFSTCEESIFRYPEPAGADNFQSDHRPNSPAYEVFHSADELIAAYLAHDILGPRLIECTRLVIAASERRINEILGSPDDMKFRSSMTLFDAVSKQGIFAEALGTFYAEGRDPATLDIRSSNSFRRRRLAAQVLHGTNPCSEGRGHHEAGDRSRTRL